MAVIDDWTSETVDAAIRLLVLAERLAETHAPDLYLEIRRFLLEEA